MSGRADFLVELRGFEPMAIAACIPSQRGGVPVILGTVMRPS